MIIFEGPDNSGKSTIASYIAHELGIPLHHFGKPPKNEIELKNRIDFMFENKDFLIFDRVPLISEQIYSILREKNLMSVIDEANAYYVRLREINPIIIYCRPAVEVMVETLHEAKTYDSKDHMLAVENKFLDLIDRYDQVMESEYLPKPWYFDYTKQEHDIFLAQLEDEVIKRNLYKPFYNEGEKKHAS